MRTRFSILSNYTHKDLFMMLQYIKTMNENDFFSIRDIPNGIHCYIAQRLYVAFRWRWISPYLVDTTYIHEHFNIWENIFVGIKFKPWVVWFGCGFPSVMSSERQELMWIMIMIVNSLFNKFPKIRKLRN